MLEELRCEIESLQNHTHDAIVATDILNAVEESKESIRWLIRGDVNFFQTHQSALNTVKFLIYLCIVILFIF